MHPYRTHKCGELRKEHVGREVRLSGWVFRKRDHGSLLFIDLRDHYGVTQVVVQPSAPFFEDAQGIKLESVVTVTGNVLARSAETVNPDLATGDIEVLAAQLAVDGPADQTPLYLAGDEEGPEDLRLKYRFLDLRRPRLHRNIVLRSAIIAGLRRRMIAHGFTEFQTPILTASSPEGARDYLVPSRVHPGCFYALPQAPQLFKQLLMVSGFDRYFQIAPCFRDEDARADRSPGEFYQMDVEMSFVTQDDVFAVLEDVLSDLYREFTTWSVTPPPFPRITYDDAMLRYGCDKPDLRIPIEMRDVTEVFAGSAFEAFKSAIGNGEVVRAIPVKGIAGQPRSFFDKLVGYAQSIGSKGLAYLVWTPETIKGPIAKFLSASQLGDIAARCGVAAGDAVFFVCAPKQEAARITGDLRLKLGADLKLAESGCFKFCWIVDFPMYERDPETGAVGFSHNPFSMPQGGLDALANKPPLEIKAFQYDIVCNGIELSSGAIRNHRPDIMYKAFEIAGYTKEETERRFGCMLNAFRYGAPPHGGIAPGVDRIVMQLAGETNIREVIAFPMNQRAQDLMMNAPAPATDKQLRELHLKVNLPKSEKAQGT
jgi:aspartyl-tRNA synthetase